MTYTPVKSPKKEENRVFSRKLHTEKMMTHCGDEKELPASDLKQKKKKTEFN